MTIEWISALSPWVGLLIAVSCLVLFISFGIFILNQYGLGISLTRVARKISVGALFVFIALLFLRDYMIEVPLRQAETFLAMPEAIIYVNSVKKNIRGDLLDAFRERIYKKRSGSNPSVFWLITIETKNESLQFNLGQDSLDRNLFWVYFPQYKRHSKLCFLRIDPENLK